MVPRDVRPRPLSLRAALLLLVPLALLGTLLLGLLAQSATAEHGSVPGPSLVGPASPDDSTAPQWTFTRPADSTVTEPAVYNGSDTRTVTITHTYDTQCVYGTSPAGEAAFASNPGGCGVLFMAPTYGYTGAVGADGSYVLSVRTAETTTTSTEIVDASGVTTTESTGPATRYSAIESAEYVLDTTAPVVTVTGPATAEYTGWTVSVSDASTVTRGCTLDGPNGPEPGFTCNSDTVAPVLTTEGNYTLTVLVTDAAGNTATTTSAPFFFDATPPAVTFTAEPTGPSRTTTVTWTWTADEAGTSSCSLAGPALPSAETCADGSYTATLSDSGTYALTVVVTDAAGNDGTATSVDYELDLVGPQLTVTPAGDTTGTGDTVTWTVDVDAAATLTCALSTGETPACTDGGTVSATLTADGSVSLTVTADDGLGNVSSTTVSYTRDTAVTVTVAGPSGPSSDRTPSWTFTGEPLASVSCALEADGDPVATPVGSTCTSTGFTSGELPTSAGTSYVLVVTVEDAVGNTDVVRSDPYLLDTTAATLSLTPAVGQDPVDNDTTPSWTFTGDTWTSPTCVLTVTGDGTALGGSCSATGFTAPVLTGPSGTEYTLTVTVVDSAGNTSTASTTYTLDTSAPSVAVSSPTHARNDTSPTFAFTFEPGIASVTCVLSSGAATFAGTCSPNLGAGSGSFTADDLAPTSGTTYTLTVTATDAAGNSASADATYLLDTSAPSVAVSSPTHARNDTSPTFAFTFESGAASVTCVLSSGATTFTGTCSPNLGAGTGSFTADDLAPTSGTTYTLTVTVVDTAGNSSTGSATYVLDTAAPSVVVSAPAATGNDRSPSFTVGVEPGATATTCTLRDESAAVVAGTCTVNLGTGIGSFTPDADLPLTDGHTYTLTVTATDSAGNTGTGSATYLLDTTVPSVTVSAPTHARNDTTPTFAFDFERGAASATCVLRDSSGTAYAGTCSRNLGQGTGTFTTTAVLPSTAGETYTLTVTVVDDAGNTGTGTATYLLDTSAPTVDVTAPPSPSSNRTPTFTFTFEAGAATVTCALSSGATTYAGTCSPNLGAGTGTFTADQLALTGGTTYTLTVTVVDTAGNSASGTAGYVLDTSAPAVSVVGPATPDADRTPTFTFTFEPGAASVTCVLTDTSGTAHAGTCTRDLGLGSGSFAADDLGLTDGTAFTLTVTVVDTAGNTSTGTASYTLDTTVPTVAVSSPTHPRNDTSPTFAFTFEPGIASVTCVLTSGAATFAGTCSPNLGVGSGSFTADDLAPTSGTTYTLTVTATDAAGNSASGSADYLLDTSAPSVAVSSPTHARNDTSPTFAFTFESGAASVTCVLTSGAATYAGTCLPNLAGGTGSFTADDLALTAGTTYTLTVTVVDTAGNSATGSADYLLDTTAPGVTVTAPTHPRNDTTPTFAFTFEPGAAAVTCALTDSGSATFTGSCSRDLGTGSGTFTADALALTPGETYTLTVTVVDTAGNSATGSADYLLDTTVPTVTVDPLTTPDNNRTPTFTATFEPGAASATCTLVDGSGAPVTGTCTVDLTAGTASFTPAAALPITSGETYVFTLDVVDTAGNPSSDQVSYELDTVADFAPGTEPDSPGNDTTPTWTWTSEPGSSVTCVLTGPGAAGGSCGASGFTAAALPGTSGADYVLTVTVVDLLGNETVVVYDYSLDTVADFAAGTEPDSPGNDTTPTWTWTAEDSSTVTCVLRDDTGAVVFDGTCTTSSSFTPAALPDTSGTTYTLTVTVVDAIGNSTTTLLPEYLLDTLSDVTPATAPPSPGFDTTPTWTWSVEDGSTASCVLVDDTGAVVFDDACTTATSFTADALPGTTGTTYTLTITVEDALGNSTTTTLATYLLDTVLELDVVGPTGPSPVRTPEWQFTAEPLTTLVCTLTGPDGVVIDGGICDQNGYRAPPLVEDGDYVLTVRGVDAAGNDVTQTFGYDLDTLHFSIDGPTGPSPDRSPTWTFTDEPYVSADCVLTGPDGVVFDGPCTTTSSFTADDLPLTPGADYVLTVTVVDSIGNEGTLTTGPYRLDTQLPVAVITVPSSPSRVVTVTWTVAVDEPLLSATCELRRDGVVLLSLANCPGSTSVTLPGDGTYDLVVTLVDLAGNTSTTTSTVLVHDATIPVAPQVSPTSVTTNRTTATWTITAEGGTSVTTCRVLRDGAVFADWATCGATFTVPLGADGSYVLEVVSTDPVGPGPTTTVTYLLDTLAPVAPQLTGPTGPSPNRAPSWTVGTEAGTSVECRLLRAGTVVLDWAPCAGSFAADLTGLPDGGYVLEARATDLAGNVSAVGAAATYVLDTTAPAAVVVTGPSGPSQLRSPAFTWSGEAGARAECQLSRDGVVVGGWVTCTPGFAPVLDRDGTWTLTVRLTDAAGNVSEPATSGGYVLDTTAPPTPVVTPPQTPGRDLAPSWGVIVESGASMECRLTGPDGITGAWAPCTLPHVTSLTGRPDGAYVLEVRATDVAGNISPVGSGTYVLDTVAPEAAVITAPASPGRTRIPTFSFTVEPAASTRCRVTSGSTLIIDYVACSGSFAVDLTGLPDGTYTVTVRVSDAAGNPGPAATGTYVLDTTGPAAPVLITSPASPSPERSVTWTFSYEPGATLICRLTFPTGAVREIASCTSPLTVPLTGLPDGTYTLTVRAIDTAGNVGGVLTDTHVIDSSALAPPTVTGPVTPGSDRTPRWTFTSATATECRLTRGTTVLIEWTPCSTQYVAALFNQPDGTYTLSVRSIANGQVSAAATSRYVLDTTAPAAATITPPPTPSTNLRPVWTIASAELGATAECSVRYFGSVLRDWAPCSVSPAGSLFDELDLTDASDGTYTLVVRLRDAAGNVGAEASSAYVLDTSAPVGVGVTGPPSPGNSRTPTWTFTTAGNLVLECRLTSDAVVISDWDTCEGSFTADLTELRDGVYVLLVRAVSEAGTPGPATSSQYILSTVLPDRPTLLVLSGTKPVDNDRSPTWTFTLPPGTTGRCVLMQGTRTLEDRTCTKEFTADLSRASDGSYTLYVYAVGEAGSESEPATSTYRLDVSAPSSPTFTLVPGSPGSTLTPQWRFTTVHGSRAECRVRFGSTLLGDWAPCDSPYDLDLTLRPDGEYVLEVRAVDDAGNSSPPRSSTYVLDRTAAPVASFTSTPPTPSRDQTVVWTFTAPEGYTLECRLTGPDRATGWESCGAATAALRTAGSLVVGSTGSYAVNLTDRPDGEYVLEVRLVDAVGNRGSASRATYLLDTRAPDRPTFSDPAPAAGNDPLPSWSWETTGDDWVECRLLRNGVEVQVWAECSSPYEARLTSQGTYRLEIRLVDGAGNRSGVTGSSYVFDTTPPDRPVLVGPPSSGSDRTVSWTFAIPPGVTATCTVTRGLNRVDERACNGGRYDLDLSGQPDGTYTLTVRFTDAAGNISQPGSGSYALRTVGLPGRVVPPPSGPAPSAPSGPGRGGTGVVVDPQEGSTSSPGVPTIPGDDDVPRLSGGGTPSTVIPPSDDREEAAGGSAPGNAPTARRDPLVTDPFPFDKLAPVIREAVTGTITRPTLPLALLAIVVLFLLAQNRIDRRDPKLASAPVEAEPELDFTLIVRRPGGALT